VKGLAQVLAKESNPERRLIAVSVDRMLAHAREPVKFENSFLKLLAEVMPPKNIVIYFDDLWPLLIPQARWTVARAAATFRSVLAHGNLQCIATATPDVYHSTIAANAVLARRFRPIFVEPPTAAETLDILRQLRPLYESHHRVQIRDDALEAALHLSDRHLPRACQPGKAVQVLDEAGALVRLRHSLQRSPQLRELEEQIEDLSRRKEEFVAIKDFEKAAELRDQIDKLKKRLQSLTVQERLREEESVGVVDAGVVAEAIHFSADSPRENRQD
jgi:ATP-dependent Clp protease ATP-binding subunit ClpC